MQRLIATFDVSLSSPLFINRSNRPAPQELRYPTRIEDSDVEIALLEVHHARMEGDRTIWAVPHIRVSVSRTETAEPPPIRRTPEGGHDFSDRHPYFSERISIYHELALEALRRFLRFFKYRQAHALLRDVTFEDLKNLKWTDETGQEVPSGLLFLAVSLYGIELDKEVGVRALVAADDSALQQALTESIHPELYEELLSDARAALFQGHLRRAILELAITCEMATKQAFFGNASAAAAVFEHLEDKGRVHISIPELLGEPAKRAFGKSFREAEKSAYDHIDHLFRCRNKVAHRGECKYHDDRGRTHTVDQALAKEWFKLADRFLAWLRSV